MNSIGGNVTAQIQVKTEKGKNRMGERLLTWSTVHSPIGFLDLANGDSNYTYNAKIQESTHVFICDYFPITVTVEQSRMVINNQVYDIQYIDDPMGLHDHLEIFLKMVGGQ